MPDYEHVDELVELDQVIGKHNIKYYINILANYDENDALTYNDGSSLKDTDFQRKSLILINFIHGEPRYRQPNIAEEISRFLDIFLP